MTHVAVMGAGSWGATLANLAAGNGHAVTLWSYRADEAALMQRLRVIPRQPGQRLADPIAVTHDRAACARADVIVMATPAQSLRDNLAALAPYASQQAALVIAAKGIERSSGLMMGEVASAILPHHRQAILSGPNFAEEIIRGLPAATVIASRDETLARDLCSLFHRPYFRPYASSDPIGAQLGGAVKNVLALACGIADGLRLGDNARAALITRGLAEMARLGQAMGADAQTFRGLAGLGDLVLSATSDKSRNLTYGKLFAAGQTPMAANGQALLAEGVHTAYALAPLCARAGLVFAAHMPISHAVVRALEKTAPVADIMTELMTRPLKNEGQ